MKKNKLLIFATTGALFLSTACSKNDLKEDQDLEGPETSMATQTTSTSTFRYGINGHPLGTTPYTSVSAKTQISLLKQKGMSLYRIDVMPRLATGEITVPYLYRPLKEAADAAGVTLLPMLYTRDLDFNLTESQSYHRGRTLGDRFARLYKNDFTYYNIGNELDNKLIYDLKSGTEVSHYDQKKFKIVAAYLKGMNDGIKAKDPDAKTIVNACWMHYQYLLMLQRAGVNYDIVGYHWYSEMDAVALKNHNISDITKFLSTKFTKPIWFTEIGFRNPDGLRSESDQKAFFDSMLAKCKNNPQVKAAVIYQLFNEPQKSTAEANYGIYKWIQTYTQFTPKLFAR